MIYLGFVGAENLFYADPSLLRVSIASILATSLIGLASMGAVSRTSLYAWNLYKERERKILEAGE